MEVGRPRNRQAVLTAGIRVWTDKGEDNMLSSMGFH